MPCNMPKYEKNSSTFSKFTRFWLISIRFFLIHIAKTRIRQDFEFLESVFVDFSANYAITFNERHPKRLHEIRIEKLLLIQSNCWHLSQITYSTARYTPNISIETRRM